MIQIQKSTLLEKFCYLKYLTFLFCINLGWFLILPPIDLVLAQSRNFDCVQNLNDKDIINKIQNAYNSVESISADFFQESYLSALDISEASSGKMYFKRPGKMLWEYALPESQIFLIDDQTVYLYHPNDKQLTIDRIKKILLSDVPVAFLMGVGDLSQDFNLKNFCKNSQGSIAELTPINQNSDIKTLKLLVNPQSFYPLGARVEDANGNVTSVIFKNVQNNFALKQDTFKPKFPKGIDINDRRNSS